MNTVFFARAGRRFGATLTLLLAAGLGNAVAAPTEPPLPESVTTLAARYPDEQIATVAQADIALQEVNAERAQVAQRYADAQQVCYVKFFATRCLDRAKEERRESLVLLRQVEVQANAVKRRLRAEDRDAVLARQREAELADAPRRAKEEEASRAAAAKKAEARAARQASESADAVKREKRDEAALAKRGLTPGTPAAAAALGTDLRAEDHLQRQAQANAKEAANADKRVANAKAFEEKAAAAEARQKQVAEKKAEKEKAREEKAAKAKAEADSKAGAEAKAKAAKAGG